MKGITVRDLVEHLNLIGPQDASVLASYAAEHIFQFRLRTGDRLFTLDDARSFLLELADALRAPVPTFTATDQVRAWNTALLPADAAQLRGEVCPDCGDVHENDDECGVYKGGAGFCRCPRKVRSA